MITIGKDLLDKTMGELKNMEKKENTTTPNGIKGLTSTVKKTYLTSRENISKAAASTAKKTSSASSRDDGYVTESSTTSEPSRKTTRMSRRRSRSAVPANDAPVSENGLLTVSRATTRKRSSSVDHQMGRPTFKAPRSESQYRTPAYKGPNQYAAITPKIPNTPMAILRRPRQGEMVMSMTGSPLMVSQMQSDEKANCNIPLYDGTMLCLLPERFRESTAPIPASLIGPDVLQQLQTLQRNLNSFVKKAKPT